MKRALLFCLVSLSALGQRTAVPVKTATVTVQPFYAVLWTTTTLHNPDGKPAIFMRRTVVSRDAAGNVREDVYRQTAGVLHDVKTPLERVLNYPTSAQRPPFARAPKESVQQDADLGSTKFSGVPASGRRVSFGDKSGQLARTSETWFAPSLGLDVHVETRNAHDDSVVTDLVELHEGSTVPAPTEAAIPREKAPVAVLYEALFMRVARTEQRRRAHDPGLTVNMEQVTEKLRKQLGLSTTEWTAMVERSLKVESYIKDSAARARAFVENDVAARRGRPDSPDKFVQGRATLLGMQQELATHMQEEFDSLKAGLGPKGAEGLEQFVNGPLAASTAAVRIDQAKIASDRAQQEQAR